MNQKDPQKPENIDPKLDLEIELNFDVDQEGNKIIKPSRFLEDAEISVNFKINF